MSTQQKKQNTGKKISLILMLVTVLIIVALNYSDTSNNVLPSYKTNASVGTGVLIPYEKSGKFHSYSGKLFYATNDGVQLIDSNNRTIWINTHSMKNPTITANESVIGVCDGSGLSLSVYDVSGFKYSAQISGGYPILSLSVNKNGFSSVITHATDYYGIYVYDNTGKLVREQYFPEQDNILPLSCSISDDNRIFAVSFLDINDIKISSLVTFYYINKNENPAADENEGFLASFGIQDSIVSIVRFMENNKLVAISDNKIDFFEVDGKNDDRTEKKAAFELNNRIEHINFINKKTIVVALGDSYNDRSKSEPRNTIKWIDMNGEQISSFKADKDITYMESDLNATIIGMSKKYAALSSKGQELWRYTATQDINDIMFVSNTDTVLMVSSNEAEILKMNDKPPPAKETGGDSGGGNEDEL